MCSCGGRGVKGLNGNGKNTIENVELFSGYEESVTLYE